MLPGTVTATLDDDSTVSVNVDWADAIPGFDGQAAGSEHDAMGDLVDLPEGVLNTAGVEAEATVVVGETDAFFLCSESDLNDALEANADVIILNNDLVLQDRVRIRHDLQVLDLNNYAITMEDGGVPLAFEGNGTIVQKGEAVKPRVNRKHLISWDLPITVAKVKTANSE